MKRVLVLGGAGAIGRHVAAGALACSAAGHVIVADRDGTAAAAVAASHPGRAESLALDIFDPAQLASAVERADAVLNCAGPFYKTSLPVLQAAIAAKKPYLDVCDGWDTTRDLLALDGAVRAAGIPAIIGLGGSPGLTNLLARIAAAELDACETVVTVAGIDAAPLPGVVSRVPARAIHWQRQLGTDVEIWQDGKVTPARPLQPVELDLPFFGRRSFHLIGHPEPLTLPHAIPGLRSARHALALSKREGALAEALAGAVAKGDLTRAEADTQIADPGARPLPLRFRMMWERLLGGFVRDLPPYFALASGQKNGRPRRALAALTRLPPGGAAGAAGAALSVGMEMALTNRIDRLGVSPPEAALDPHLFFEEYAAAATVRGTAPGALIRIETAEGP
ncbi:MAG: saccharopine dehydrogenase NADP-binding domain-containing protein [Micropepsaceae bacterium]